MRAPNVVFIGFVVLKLFLMQHSLYQKSPEALHVGVVGDNIQEFFTIVSEIVSELLYMVLFLRW